MTSSSFCFRLFAMALERNFIHQSHRVWRLTGGCLAAAFALLCFAVSAANSFAAPPAGYYLVWSDEFNGAGLDSAKWANWLLGTRRDAINVADAITFNGSNLVLTTYTSNNVHYTGMVSTSGKFHVRLGYVEANINYDDTNGMWSAYWAQSPTMGKYIGDAYTSGVEFDVCEHRKMDSSGNNIDGYVQTNIHWDGYGSDHKSVGSGNIGSGLGTGFHTYGWEWTASQYRISIDGSQKYSTGSALSGHTEFLILSSEVQNGSWAGSIPSSGYGSRAASTTRMVVDYVRYYAPTNMIFWDGSASADWTNSANWVAGLTPVVSSDVVFSYLSTANPAMTLAQDTSVRSVAILETPSAISINGNTLTINAGGIDLISANNSATINSTVVLGAAQTWQVGTSRTLSVNGPISGSGNLTISGYGGVTLAASNSFTASVTVNRGTLTLAHSEALGSAGKSTTVSSNAQLLLSGGSNLNGPIDEPLVLYGNTNGVYAAPLRVGGSTPAATWTGPITLMSDAAIQLDGSRLLTFTNAATISGTNADLTLAGDGGSVGTIGATVSLGSGALLKSGSGTWRLFASNNFSGDTRITGGILSLNHTNALQLSTLDLNTNDTGSIALNNLPIVLGGLKGGRTLALGSGPVTIGNNSQSTLYEGTLSGAAKIVKLGGGTLTFAGTNTYTGGTLVSGGTLQLGSNTPGGSVSGVITNHGDVSICRSDATTLVNPIFGGGDLNVLATNGLSIDAVAPVNLGGNLNVGQSAYGKLMVKPGANVTAGSLYVGNPANVSGDVIQLGGALTLTNQFRLAHWPNETSTYTLGGGTLTLTAKPSGPVNLPGVAEQPGILYLGIDGTAAFTQTGGIASADGIVLDGRGESTGTDTFTLNGGTFVVGASGIKSGNLDSNITYQINLGGGALGASASWSSSRTMLLTGVNGSAFFDTGTNSITLSGPLSGPGGLVKLGVGLLNLTGTNSFSGNTVVSNGTLALFGNNAGGGAITVAPAGTLRGPGSNVGPVTVQGTIDPGASIGRLTTGAQTWTGGGACVWEIANATNSAAWDLLAISGPLTIQATPTNRFVFRLVSLTAGGAPGAMAGFNNASNYTWLVATASGGITGFDPSRFSVDISTFSNDLGGGAFTVEQSANSVVVKFHPNSGPPQFITPPAMTGGEIHLAATGVPGKVYDLLAATNLAPPLTWAWITNATADVSGALSFTDAVGTNSPQRFYRITAP